MSWIGTMRDVVVVVLCAALGLAITIGVPLLMVAMAGWAWRLF